MVAGTGAGPAISEGSRASKRQIGKACWPGSVMLMFIEVKLCAGERSEQQESISAVGFESVLGDERRQ